MDEFIAYRGGKQLSEEEFRSHMALVTRLENVGVFLGAGASKKAGGYLMSDVWETFANDHSQSKGWLEGRDFAEGNVETLLDQLSIAAEEWNRQGKTRTLKQLQQHQDNLRRAVLRGGLLSEELISNPTSVMDAESLKDHRNLLARLVGNRQPGQGSPWIFTTNYDLAVEWAAEAMGLRLINGFAGLHFRSFAPQNFDLAFRNIQARGEARFGIYHTYLVKLHGSLSWLIQGKGEEPRELATDGLWPVLDSFLKGSRKSDWPGFMVFPSAAKYMQTVGFVFGELVRRFTEFLARPHTTLIVNGYSFGDSHLNRVLSSALNNPTFHLVIYLRDYQGPESESGNAWVRALMRESYPQVTIVGSGDRANFERMVADIPEPALLDDYTERARKFLRAMAGELSKELPVVAEEEQP